uniref:Ubiquitin-like domain-containing protein n=1 Tax=Panagrolaimus sp. PS1159 TaxID=55785 RepID=A0AC35FYZ0_9BILA
MRIEIHSFNGIHFDLDVERSETIKEVGQKIRSKVNYPISQQSLTYECDKLEDDNKTLSYYKIKDGASLRLWIAGEWKITVELMNDLVINLQINPNYSIGHIKFAIENKTQIPTEIQRLFLNGKELEGFVADTGIQDGSILALCVFAKTKQTAHSVLVCCAKIEIFVNISGRKIVVGTKEDDLIKEVKLQIRVMEELRFHKQRLMFNGTELEDDKRLCDYGIVDGSVIDMIEKPYNKGELISVTVESGRGSRIIFKVYDHCNALELKLALQHSLKVAFRQQRLLFGGRQLDNYKTLLENNVKDGDVIKLYECMCGC